MTSVEGSVGVLPKNEMAKPLSSQHSNPTFILSTLLDLLTIQTSGITSISLLILQFFWIQLHNL